MYCNSRSWKTSLIVEVVAYWAVPCFLMLTGATLMNYRKKYDTKTFFKKRILKTVIPFIIWSVIMIVWKYYTNRIQINEISIVSITNIILNNRQEDIYWFFWILFSVYICIPVLSLLTDEKYRKILWYMVIVSASFSSLPLICKLLDINWNSSFNFPICSGYLMYVILGYLISTQNIEKKKRILVYCLGVISILIRYFATLVLSVRDGITNKLFFGYTYFTAVFLSLAVFIFTKYINFDKLIKSKKTINLLSNISSCSFGIYLIHRIIMPYEVKILGCSTGSWQWRTFGALLTYVICLILVYILKKIPVLKRIVP